jgi:anti-sigma factor RsiW
MQHINTEDLVDYMDGRVSGERRLELENHLSTCNDCVELKNELRLLVLRLQEDTAFEPSAELVQWGLSLFQPLLQPSTGGKLRKLIASLVFDTFDQPVLAGVRRVGAPPRQLCFGQGMLTST